MSEEDLLTELELSGLGRRELLCIIHSLQVIHAHLTKERDQYLANLTSTQERCTELLLKLRSYEGL